MRMKVSMAASVPAFKVVLICTVLCCIWNRALYGAET